MNKRELTIKLLNRNGLRWMLSLLFQILCFLKHKIRVRISFESKTNSWIHKDSQKVYYIDNLPSYGVCFKSFSERVHQYYFTYKPKSGDIIIDVGAGVGTESIVYTNDVGNDGKVYAIEAHPNTLKYLHLLKKYNSLDNLNIHFNAISDSDRVLYINDNENHVVNAIDEEKGKYEVNAVTLDNFVKNQKIKRIDYIKMNIEGAEVDAFKAMNYTFSITSNIAVETHDFLSIEPSTKIRDEIVRTLELNGFKTSSLKTGHKVRDSWIFGTKLISKE